MATLNSTTKLSQLGQTPPHCHPQTPNHHPQPSFLYSHSPSNHFLVLLGLCGTGPYFFSYSSISLSFFTLFLRQANQYTSFSCGSRLFHISPIIRVTSTILASGLSRRTSLNTSCLKRKQALRTFLDGGVGALRTRLGLETDEEDIGVLFCGLYAVFEAGWLTVLHFTSALLWQQIDISHISHALSLTPYSAASNFLEISANLPFLSFNLPYLSIVISLVDFGRRQAQLLGEHEEGRAYIGQFFTLTVLDQSQTERRVRLGSSSILTVFLRRNGSGVILTSLVGLEGRVAGEGFQFYENLFSILISVRVSSACPLPINFPLLSTTPLLCTDGCSVEPAICTLLLPSASLAFLSRLFLSDASMPRQRSILSLSRAGVLNMERKQSHSECTMASWMCSFKTVWQNWLKYSHTQSITVFISNYEMGRGQRRENEGWYDFRPELLKMRGR